MQTVIDTIFNIQSMLGGAGEAWGHYWVDAFTAFLGQAEDARHAIHVGTYETASNVVSALGI